MADFESLAATFEQAKLALDSETGRTKVQLLAGIRALQRKHAEVREQVGQLRELIKRTFPWRGSVFFVRVGPELFNAHSLRTGRLMCGACTMDQITRQLYVIQGRCRGNPALPGCNGRPPAGSPPQARR